MKKMMLLQVFDTFDLDADFVFIDTAAGISDTVFVFQQPPPSSAS